MKKRFEGFTLIELLVVIVLIALVALLVSAGVVRNLKKSNDGITTIQKNNIITAANLWINDYCENPIDEEHRCSVSYSNDKKVCLSTLINNELIDDNIKSGNDKCDGYVLYENIDEPEVILYCTDDDKEMFRNSVDCSSIMNNGENIYVVFDADGGKYSDDEDKIMVEEIVGEKYSLPIENPTKNGYTFNGWYLDDVEITTDSTVSKRYSHVVTAVWNSNNYLVTFNLNGGQINESSSFNVNGTLSKNVTFNEKYGTLPGNDDLSYSGFMFDKWTYESNIITSDSIVSVSDNHELDANYIPSLFTITYVLNGGTGCSTDSVQYGTSPTLCSSITKENNVFLGWYADSEFSVQVSDENGNLIQNVSGYTDSASNWIKQENTTLYARWRYGNTCSSTVTTSSVKLVNGSTYAYFQFKLDYEYVYDSLNNTSEVTIKKFYAKDSNSLGTVYYGSGKDGTNAGYSNFCNNKNVPNSYYQGAYLNDTLMTINGYKGMNSFCGEFHNYYGGTSTSAKPVFKLLDSSFSSYEFKASATPDENGLCKIKVKVNVYKSDKTFFATYDEEYQTIACKSCSSE